MELKIETTSGVGSRNMGRLVGGYCSLSSTRQAKKQSWGFKAGCSAADWVDEALFMKERRPHIGHFAYIRCQYGNLRVSDRRFKAGQKGFFVLILGCGGRAVAVLHASIKCLFDADRVQRRIETCSFGCFGHNATFRGAVPGRVPMPYEKHG